MLRTIADLIQTAVVRPISHQRLPDPVQTPRYGRDSKGNAFMMLTCNECLRSFPFSYGQIVEQEIQQASCPFCIAQVPYGSGYSVSGAAQDARSADQAGSVAA